MRAPTLLLTLLAACNDPSGSTSPGPDDGTTPATPATATSEWDRMCAAVPTGSDSDAAVEALAALPEAKEQHPVLLALLRDAPRCQRLDAAKRYAQDSGAGVWTCPALESSLACDPADDLSWICDRAREQVSGGALTPTDHRAFTRAVMTGRRPPAPGAPPSERPRGALYAAPDTTETEHDLHPDLAYGGQSGCELVDLLEAYATKSGATEWSCPELATAVGCER